MKEVRIYGGAPSGGKSLLVRVFADARGVVKVPDTVPAGARVIMEYSTKPPAPKVRKSAQWKADRTMARLHHKQRTR